MRHPPSVIAAPYQSRRGLTTANAGRGAGWALWDRCSLGFARLRLGQPPTRRGIGLPTLARALSSSSTAMRGSGTRRWAFLGPGAIAQWGAASLSQHAYDEGAMGEWRAEGA